MATSEKLLGYRIVRAADDSFPEGMHAQAVYSIPFCLAWIRQHAEPRAWRLLPTYAGDVDDPQDLTRLTAWDAAGYDPTRPPEERKALSAVPQHHLVRYRDQRAYVWDRCYGDGIGSGSFLLFEDLHQEQFHWDEHDPMVYDLGPGKATLTLEPVIPNPRDEVAP